MSSLTDQTEGWMRLLQYIRLVFTHVQCPQKKMPQVSWKGQRAMIPYIIFHKYQQVTTGLCKLIISCKCLRCFLMTNNDNTDMRNADNNIRES